MSVEAAEHQVPETVRRTQLLTFSARLSDELRRSARQARMRGASGKRGKAVRFVREVPWLARPLALVSRWSFVLCVLLPALLLGLYYGLMASNQYTAEARFALRAGDTTSIDTITALTGLPSITQFQDTLIVVDYLKSRALVEALDERVHLTELFNRPGMDWLSRLGKDQPVEKLLAYWRAHLNTSIEMPSGIVTVQVTAFSPEDAKTIADAVIKLGEGLVNELGERARRDLLSASEREVQRAEDRLREARAAMKDLRNEVGMLDPKTAAEGIQQIITALKTDQIRLRQEMATTSRSLNANAPQVYLLKLRDEATQEQIDMLERQLTAPNPKGTNTISNVITRFEEIELNRVLAERLYTLAVTNLERSRVNAERQQLYLNTFVRPVLSQEPDGPRRTRNMVIGVAAFLLLWGAGVGAAQFLAKLRRK